MSKLRRFIIRNLLSFSKPTNQIQTGTDPETGIDQTQDPGGGTEPEDGNEDEAMETELVIDMNGQGEAKVIVIVQYCPNGVLKFEKCDPLYKKDTLFTFSKTGGL